MTMLVNAGRILKSNNDSSDHKVSVEQGLTPGYLKDVVEVESPITMSVKDNKLHFRWDGTSNNTLTLISNMSLANATIQRSAITGTTSPGSKYSMTLSAFDIPNYFNLLQTDVFGIVTTNLVSDVSFFKVAIYKLDFDTNVLNLVAISKDFAPYISRVHGYMEIEVDTIFRPSMDSYGIYYVGVLTDQPSINVAAGPDATLFNTTKPYLGITFHNIDNDTILSAIDLNNSTADGKPVSFQESVARVCCVYRHILDEQGDPIVPTPDPVDPEDPPTPEDPDTYTEEVLGSIYWLQKSVDGITFTFYSDNGPVVNVEWNSSDSWAGSTVTNKLQDYTDTTGIKYKFGQSGTSPYDTTITKPNGDKIEIHLVEENNQYVSGSYIKVYRYGGGTDLLKKTQNISVDGIYYDSILNNDGLHVMLNETNQSLDDALADKVTLNLDKKYGPGTLTISAKSISTSTTTSTNNVFGISFDNVSGIDIKNDNGTLVAGNDSGSINTDEVTGTFDMPIATDRIYIKSLWSNTSEAKERHKCLLITKLEVN